MSRIPKRRGGFREINAPDKFMRMVQARIYSRLLSKATLPDYTWAFEPGRSVPEMAKCHVGKKVVVSLDIRNFFPSITQKMVERMIQVEGIATGPAARTISELCTYKWYLPQGGITSPKVSNLIVKNTFGPRVKQYCDEVGLEMTVYADDITLSEKEGYEIVREGSSLVVRNINRHVHVPLHSVISGISTRLNTFGFKVNEEKTKVMVDGTRKTVCNVVVNEKTNLNKKERLRLRAMVHNVCKNGLKAEADKFGDGVSESHFLSYLRGKLNWYNQLNPEKASVLIEKLNAFLQQSSEEPAQQESTSVA